MRSRNYLFASLIAMTTAMPALAQTEPQTVPAPEERSRDVVVITANKREETVQDIAVAVTATDTMVVQGDDTVTEQELLAGLIVMAPQALTTML